MTIRNWLPRLLGLVGVTILMTNCANGPLFVRLHDCDGNSLIICGPAITPPPPHTDTFGLVSVPFTITCSDLQTHTVQAGEIITLSIFSAVFIEPSPTPKDWYAAIPERVLELPERAGKLAYAPTDFEPDIVTLTFVMNEDTGEATTRSLFIRVVPQGGGLCD